MKLRPAQEEILQYRGGKLAVSAVPGSGKTFTLSLLAAELLTQQLVDVDEGHSVLVVTYLNTSVENFRAGIRRRLEQLNLPLRGFDVRTLHSLALEIIQQVEDGGPGVNPAYTILNEAERSRYLSESTANFISFNPEIWERFESSVDIPESSRLRAIVSRTASPFIREAKNNRLKPEGILDRLTTLQRELDDSLWLRILTEIYKRYQAALQRSGAYDFDDLIWQAVDLVENRADIKSVLSNKWPFVLEDEAQDSVPLQERLLDQITAITGNWVRVGDPNQAITSSFTSSHPRYFNAFCDRGDVETLSLPNSGRSAPMIQKAANALVAWTSQHHPLEQARKNTFRRQPILPVPEGDAQTNPGDEEAAIEIRVFSSLEEHEIPHAVVSAQKYLQNHPDHTSAVLVPTNRIGLLVAGALNEIGASFDDLLRTRGSVKRILSAITSILSLLADSGNTRYLIESFDTYLEFNKRVLPLDKKQVSRLQALVRSITRKEMFFFPSQDGFGSALPPNVASDSELAILKDFSSYIRQFYRLLPLPYGDLVLAIGKQLSPDKQQLNSHSDQTVVYQIASAILSWLDHSPQWRLPDIVNELRDLSSGQYSLPNLSANRDGYEPRPGVITLSTQHGAKGLEWDAVYIIGLDSFWLPSSLEDRFIGVVPALDGDPVAETTALLNFVMFDRDGSDPTLGATEVAHIEVICERLRLLYVGITRAKRFLHLSRSRQVSWYNKPEKREHSKAVEAIYRYRAHREQ